MSTLMGVPLPRFVVIKSGYYDNRGYAHREEDDLVALGEVSALSTPAKIEVERAKSNPKYVHLRFCSSNKYWALNEKDGRFIVAETNKAEEDTSKPTCTLLEAVVEDEDKGLFYLNHIQSGGRRLSIDGTTMAFAVVDQFSPEQGNLSFVDWDTLVKLPKNIAFKGYNGSWLGGVLSNGVNYLQYSVDDSNKNQSTYKIQQLPDGHVRIYSNHFEKYCRRGDSDWIVGDSSDATYEDDDSIFWPVKITGNTIALRNKGNGKFCVGLDSDGKTRCLNASAPNITTRAHIVIEELVMARKIYEVRYRMEDARIFDERPFFAGTTTTLNYSDSAAEIEVEVGYENQKSHSFTRSLSLMAGVTTTMEVGVPFISNGKISTSYEMETKVGWETAKSTTESVMVKGSVTVPPKTKAVVTCVGTMGTCDIPFSYMQQDKRSTDGKIIISDLTDGVFRGVNSYNFSFTILETEPLG